jgi:hypothetical protein
VNKNIILLFICGLLMLSVWAEMRPPPPPNQWATPRQSVGKEIELTEGQWGERMAIITNLNHASWAWQEIAIPRMLQEANWAAARLKLPTHYPIQITDIVDCFAGSPSPEVFYSSNRFPDTIYGAHIYDSDIPRDARMSALQIGIAGRIANTNFEFGFEQGKLCRVTRMSRPAVEYYADNLDGLVGKPSLIDTNGAYQLATQWLAAVDIDMAALNKLKWTVNQLHYKGRGMTNYATLPLYYVDFGNIHYPADGNIPAFDKPQVSVEVLGTTKELQELMIKDLSFSRRPLMLVTNVLEMIRTPVPPIKQMRRWPDGSATNETAPSPPRRRHRN